MSFWRTLSKWKSFRLALLSDIAGDVPKSTHFHHHGRGVVIGKGVVLGVECYISKCDIVK